MFSTNGSGSERLELFQSETSASVDGLQLEFPWLSWSAVAEELLWKDSMAFSGMAHNWCWQRKEAPWLYPCLLSLLSRWGGRWVRSNLLHTWNGLLPGGAGLPCPGSFRCALQTKPTLCFNFVLLRPLRGKDRMLWDGCENCETKFLVTSMVKSRQVQQWCQLEAF